MAGAEWIDAVRQQTTSAATAGLINELGVEAIRVDEDKLPRYIGGVLARLQEVWVGRQIAEVKSKLQRMSPVDNSDEYHALFGDLVAMEAYRRSCWSRPAATTSPPDPGAAQFALSARPTTAVRWSISVSVTIRGSGETRLAMVRRPASITDRATGLPVRAR
ncbi:DNA primase [Mycobacterium talmoniae]|uniref:DNA primase n=1 Tax=Mycobacterium talmoniae TaxID=1858794 RepID=A0A2S8BML0_9MYCO|nr:DNA primase [Mycobacterium talmoniae]